MATKAPPFYIPMQENMPGAHTENSAIFDQNMAQMGSTTLTNRMALARFFNEIQMSSVSPNYVFADVTKSKILGKMKATCPKPGVHCKISSDGKSYCVSCHDRAMVLNPKISNATDLMQAVMNIQKQDAITATSAPVADAPIALSADGGIGSSVAAKGGMLGYVMPPDHPANNTMTRGGVSLYDLMRASADQPIDGNSAPATAPLPTNGPISMAIPTTLSNNTNVGVVDPMVQLQSSHQVMQDVPFSIAGQPSPYTKLALGNSAFVSL